jgi:NNP family nitrate/nitrite transporter-like MFS transporter
MKAESKILSFATVAFFITFIIWFNLPPLALEMGLTVDEIKKLLLLNVALTIPARVLVGMLVDKYGPKIMYSGLLALSGVLAIVFTFATTYEWMAVIRALQGITGAGFVIGIRLVSEWYSHKNIGLAEGLYGGFGNFGSAAAAMTLPTLSAFFGGWEAAMIATGIVAIVYSGIFYMNVTDLPSGAVYHRPVGSPLLPTATKTDLTMYVAMLFAMYASLALIVYKLDGSLLFYGILLAGFIAHSKTCFKNHGMVKGNEYKMKQVGILSLAYMASFGSGLAVISILPLYFLEVFSLTATEAGLVASSYAVMNLVSRATGGNLSDKYGRKRVLTILLLLAGVGYSVMANMVEYGLLVSIIITMIVAFAEQASEGSTFASVPLIKKSLTGQVAGTVGSFGTMGAVIFLSLYTFLDAEVIFYVLSGTALVVGVLALVFFEEPGDMTEALPDGTVVTIKLD